MKCPNCKKDDNCWIIRRDEVEHVSCSFKTKASDMLDHVRACYCSAR